MLKAIDFLGPRIYLRINNNEKLKSTIGGLSTIFMLIVSVGAFFAFGLDIYQRKNPTVRFNKVDNSNPIHVITHLNFLFAIYDQWSDKPFPEFERKFYSYLDHIEYDGKGGNKITKYYFEKCSNNTISKWKGYFYNISANNWRLTVGNTSTINGVFGEGKHDALRLQTKYCDNIVNINKNCYSRDFIEKNITDRIQMHYITESSKLDTINYKQPARKIAYTGLTNTNANTWNRLTILFMNTLVNTDTGFFISDIRKDLYNGINKYVKIDSVYSKGTDTIFSHFMGNDKYMEVYTRSYIKVQNVFALMGGFVNGAMISFGIILKYLTRGDIVNIFNNTYKYKPVSMKAAL